MLDHWQHIKRGLVLLDEEVSHWLLVYVAITSGCLSAIFWGRFGWFCVGLALVAVGLLMAYTLGRYGDDDLTGPAGHDPEGE